LHCYTDRRGNYALTASFAGNSSLLPSTATTDFTVMSPPTVIPTFTPLPTATPEPTPTVVTPTAGVPTATPTAVALSTHFTAPGANLIGAPGQQVKASLSATNNTGGPETISSVTLALSNPGLFSSLSLSLGGQTDVITAPGASNAFTFSPPLALATGASLTFTATATIAAHPVMNFPDSGGVFYATMIPISPSTGSMANLPLFGSLTLLGFGLMLWPTGARRRLPGGALLTLALAVGQAGCGSSGPNTVTVNSTVTATAATASGADGTTQGLPLKVATIFSSTQVDP
jgi:hypothetical protein